MRAAGTISESVAHERGVFEHVMVIEGERELQIAGQWQRLMPEEGDFSR